MKIVLFDPALKDNTGQLSDNLGDAIIHEFVEKALKEMFPGKTIQRIATHSLPPRELKQGIQPEDLCFLGGSNILNSTVNVYNNWHYDRSFFETLATKRLRVITLGVGWGEYQQAPGFHSRLFYSRRLDRNKLHSVRDSYSATQLEKISGMKAINTGCPTTWELNGTPANRGTTKQLNTCVFTLTDYSREPKKDTQLVTTLLEQFTNLVYFPQGTKDLDYLQSLPVYKNNTSKFTILPRTLDAFKAALKKDEVIYIGTRLHAGILALNLGVESLIISIDNRAREMAKDMHLPVVERDEIQRIGRWLKAEKIFPKDVVTVPLQNIATWKKQFSR